MAFASPPRSRIMDDSRGGYVRCTMCETENEIDGQLIKDVYMSTKRAQVICISCGAVVRVDFANATGGEHALADLQRILCWFHHAAPNVRMTLVRVAAQVLFATKTSV